MIPEINIRGNSSVASINGAKGSGGREKTNKFSGTKERLDWLKIDLNAAKIIIVQECKHIKINMNGSTHMQQY